MNHSENSENAFRNGPEHKNPETTGRIDRFESDYENMKHYPARDCSEIPSGFRNGVSIKPRAP